MDDFKVISESEEQLQKQAQTDKFCSDTIHTEFGIDNFEEIVLKKKGKFFHFQNLILLDLNREIQQFGEGKKYEHGGFNRNGRKQHK